MENSNSKNEVQNHFEFIREITGLNIKFSSITFADSIPTIEEFSKKSLPKFIFEMELDTSEVTLVEKIRKETLDEFNYFSIPDINQKLLIPMDDGIRGEILKNLSLFEIFTIKFISENFTDTLIIKVERIDLNSEEEEEDKFWKEKFLISVTGINLIKKIIKLIYVG